LGDDSADQPEAVPDASFRHCSQARLTPQHSNFKARDLHQTTNSLSKLAESSLSPMIHRLTCTKLPRASAPLRSATSNAAIYKKNRSLRVLVQAKMYVPSDRYAGIAYPLGAATDRAITARTRSFGGISPEKKAANGLRTLFTFVAVKSAHPPAPCRVPPLMTLAMMQNRARPTRGFRQRQPIILQPGTL
jgi:hypothetical protein